MHFLVSRVPCVTFCKIDEEFRRHIPFDSMGSWASKFEMFPFLPPCSPCVIRHFVTPPLVDLPLYTTCAFFIPLTTPLHRFPSKLAHIYTLYVALFKSICAALSGSGPEIQGFEPRKWSKILAIFWGTTHYVTSHSFIMPTRDMKNSALER